MIGNLVVSVWAFFTIIDLVYVHSLVQVHLILKSCKHPKEDLFKLRGLKVVNPFDSPSLIKNVKDASEFNNPYESPSVQVNVRGGIRGIDPRTSPSCIILVREGTETVDALKSPSVEYLGIKEKSELRTLADLPLALIVGQESIKRAMLMLAVNPLIGGLAITGGRGAGKSTLARAMHRLMPPISVVKDSAFNIAPTASEFEIDDLLRAALRASNQSLADAPSESLPCPFVQVPVNILEDRLFGSMDVKRTVESGATVFTPGLLAAANRGVLFVDDINLLDPDLVSSLLQSIQDGFVAVEREGISVRYPCRPLLICTYNTEDAEFKAAFQDRIGMALSVDEEPLGPEQRRLAVQQVTGFQDDTLTDAVVAAYHQEVVLREQIRAARRVLAGTPVSQAMSREQLLYLCEQATRGGCEGHNGEVTAARIALASAALRTAAAMEGEEAVEGSSASPMRVTAKDLRLAVRLAILPRSSLEVVEEESEATTAAPSQQSPQPSSDDQKGPSTRSKAPPERPSEEEAAAETSEEAKEAETEPVPPNLVFATSPVAIKTSLTTAASDATPPHDVNLYLFCGYYCQFLGKQTVGVGRRSGRIYSRDRGRYVRAVMPREGETIRVAVDATLREAAKHQRWRRREAGQKGGDTKRVYVEDTDIRAKLMARKAGAVLIFVVDSSGSMAVNRMNAAKGAAVSLLSQAYQHRDKVAMVNCHGNAAEVILPPTRSVVLAKRRLEEMPCGGGTPLSHGLTLAVRTGLAALLSGNAGKCVIVLITDGGANVPLSDSLQYAADAQDIHAQNPARDEPSVAAGFGVAAAIADRDSAEAVADTASAVDSQRQRSEIPLYSPSGDTTEPAEAMDVAKSGVVDRTKEKAMRKERIREEVIGIGRQIAYYSKLKLLVIDTSARLSERDVSQSASQPPRNIGRSLAAAAKGRYFLVPRISAEAARRVAAAVISATR